MSSNRSSTKSLSPRSSQRVVVIHQTHRDSSADSRTSSGSGSRSSHSPSSSTATTVSSSQSRSNRLDGGRYIPSGRQHEHGERGVLRDSNARKYPILLQQLLERSESPSKHNCNRATANHHPHEADFEAASYKYRNDARQGHGARDTKIIQYKPTSR